MAIDAYGNYVPDQSAIPQGTDPRLDGLRALLGRLQEINQNWNAAPGTAAPASSPAPSGEPMNWPAIEAYSQANPQSFGANAAGIGVRPYAPGPANLDDLPGSFRSQQTSKYGYSTRSPMAANPTDVAALANSDWGKPNALDKMSTADRMEHWRKSIDAYHAIEEAKMQVAMRRIDRAAQLRDYAASKGFPTPPHLGTPNPAAAPMGPQQPAPGSKLNFPNADWSDQAKFQPPEPLPQQVQLPTGANSPRPDLPVIGHQFGPGTQQMLAAMLGGLRPTLSPGFPGFGGGASGGRGAGGSWAPETPSVPAAERMQPIMRAAEAAMNPYGQTPPQFDPGKWAALWARMSPYMPWNRHPSRLWEPLPPPPAWWKTRPGTDPMDLWGQRMAGGAPASD
jgi:hypothetical protein